jgi:hypothetical protein
MHDDFVGRPVDKHRNPVTTRAALTCAPAGAGPRSQAPGTSSSATTRRPCTNALPASGGARSASSSGSTRASPRRSRRETAGSSPLVPRERVGAAVRRRVTLLLRTRPTPRIRSRFLSVIGRAFGERDVDWRGTHCRRLAQVPVIRALP